MVDRARWYVVHTYSGYENKVKANLEKTIENRNISDLIMDIQVPIDEQVELKDGKKKTVNKKRFPGYVLVKMILNDNSWYVVRNTRGVTGFVGLNPNKPMPLSDDDVRSLRIKEKVMELDIQVGENVRVISGPLENLVALVQEINTEKHKIKALVNMFGRETSAELNYDQIEKF